MTRRTKLVGSVLALVLIGGTAYAASESWRPGMPAFFVDFRTAGGGKPAPALMLIYSEEGRDPFLDGHLAPGQRITACQTVDSHCVSEPTRREFGIPRDRPQSLQIRLFNGDGNPIIGGFRWDGPWHPHEVRVICDLRVLDRQKSCVLAGTRT